MEPEKLFLVSTTQRCGSTWLTRLLCEMTGSPSVYLDCTALGFNIGSPSVRDAIPNLEQALKGIESARVIKTHDIPRKDFDAVCSAFPQVRILTLTRDFKDIMISRYFYYRYYWPTDPGLGALPRGFAAFLEFANDLPDKLAVSALLRFPVLERWAREWAAFEGGFSTSNAIRLRYEVMLEEVDHRRLEEFTGMTFSPIEAFEETQTAETMTTGRGGNCRFNREGRRDQWKEWLTIDEGTAVDSLVERCRQSIPLSPYY